MLGTKAWWLYRTSKSAEDWMVYILYNTVVNIIQYTYTDNESEQPSNGGHSESGEPCGCKDTGADDGDSGDPCSHEDEDNIESVGVCEQVAITDDVGYSVQSAPVRQA